MMRWGVAAALSLGVAAVFVGVPVSGQQITRCNPYHPDQAFQKGRMIALARDINAAEARVFADTGAYQPLPQLQLASLPQWLDIRLTTDGTSYALSLASTVDPCRLKYFSDQGGRIYAGEVIQ